MSVLSLENDFVSVFLDESNPFRESMTYTPSGGAAKAIYGIINRGAASRTTQDRAVNKIGAVYSHEIIISCNATSGIANVVVGKDKVSFISPEFAETNTYTIAGIIHKTAMCWKLGLRP